MTRSLWIAFCLMLVSMSVFAQDAIQPYLEYRKRIEMAQNIAPLEQGLFGEQVSLYNGSTTFSITDIDIPGNNALPVQLRREFAVELQPQNDIGEYDALLRGAGNWDVSVPYMAASYNVSAGDALRCNGAYVPGLSIGAGFRRGDVWQGISIHVPGRGNTSALGMQTTTPRPSGSATYKLTTSQRDVFDCIPMQAGFAGEGFRMTTTAGLRYYFDIGATRTAARLLRSVKTDGQLPVPVYLDRNKLYLLASKVEDRFGNTVQFQYNSNGHPTRIWSNDGREIVLSYTGGRLSSATSHGHVWQYQYTNAGSGLYARLSTVILPDASRWQYTYTSDLMPPPDPASLASMPWCTHASPMLGASLTFTATHPSGAVGTFDFNNTRHFRSGVHATECEQSGDPFNPDYDLLVPYYYDVMSIQSKVISGAGLSQPLTWGYAYAPHAQTLWGVHTTPLPYPCTTCSVEKVVTLTNPDNTKSKYHFGMRYHDNDGRLLEVENLDAAGAVMRTESDTYMTEAAAATQPFSGEYGSNLGGTSDPASVRIRPVVNRTITQDGVNFVLQANSFDTFARPKNQTRSSTALGNPVRTEETAYHDNLALWVLGQVSKVLCKTPSTPSECTAAGIETFERTYDATYALPLTTERFGKVEQVVAWDISSSLASGQRGTAKAIADGAGHQTTLANYKRSTPQAITTPDAKTLSAVVDDLGQIVSLTDQAGSTTTYTYDPIGRLAGITYPTGDEQVWLPQSFAYAYVTSAENGVAAGHWRRTASQGNARTVSYFDALLRPLLETRYISGTGGSNITRRTAYDWKGQVTFASYPVAGLPLLASVTAGTTSTYDALGRLSKTEQSSELGTLTTSTTYLTGAVRQVTDPKGNVVTTSYQMFDQPSYDAPVKIVAPTGLTQTITRGVYGHTLAINQSGVYGTESLSVDKTFIYDSNRRLCRSTEPESGSTVMAYDAADNLVWSASGLAITGSGCGQEQVLAAAKTTRTYDPMNRLLTVLPPAGTQSTIYTYDVLGNPKTAISGISNWTAAYNKRGMLTSETLLLSGQPSKTLTYAHDIYGSVSQLIYPNGEVVAYTPDALGRSTTVGDYLTGIGYFPNGEVAQAALGNGALYVAEQNARQLLHNFSYAKGSTLNLSEDLSYDKNGNLAQVADLAGGPRDKTLDYDALNRLTNATAASLWGTETYAYDPLNNLRERINGSQTTTYNYNSLNQLASLTGTGATTFGYDTRGNVVNKGGIALGFDQKNQLLSLPGVSYAYDAAGRRVKKIVGGVETYHFYSQAGQLLHQWEPGSNKATTLIWLGRKPVARSVKLGAGAATAIYSYADAQGTPLAEANASGTVTAVYDYRSYGAQALGTPPNGIGYGGHVNDVESGFVYMQQRYYDPVGARFLSVDPVTAYSNPKTNFNRYWYANNNPYRYTDPDGRQSYEDLSLTGMAADEMLRNGEITESEHLDMWAQGAFAGGKGLAIGVMAALPGPEDIAIVASTSRLLLAGRASKNLSQAIRYVESVTEKTGRTGGRSGRRTITYDGKGGREAAGKMFDKLTGGKYEARGDSKLGSLGDGSTVQMSSRTLKDGTTETSIRITSERTGSHIKDMRKIRFRN